MTIVLLARDPSAASVVARVSDAVRRIASCAGTDPGPAVPAPLAPRGQVLFACLAGNDHSRRIVERECRRHALDAVLADIESPQTASSMLRFSLGIHLSWTMLWHPGFRLWLDEDGNRPACFIPEDIEDRTHFWIEDGQLTCDCGTPFANWFDRERGIRAAEHRMTQLLEER